MAKFRKKPVVIDAEQFDPDATNWPEGVVVDTRSPTGYSIGTLENTAQGHEVTPGDWIITGVKGEKYPCKDDVFRQTYEPVEPLVTAADADDEILDNTLAATQGSYLRAQADLYPTYVGPDYVGHDYVGPDEVTVTVTVDTVQPPETPSSAACQTTWDQSSTTNTDVCVDTSISFDSGGDSN